MATNVKKNRHEKNRHVYVLVSVLKIHVLELRQQAGLYLSGVRGVEPPCTQQLTPWIQLKMVWRSILTNLIVCDCVTFRDWYHLTINARNYFGNLLFANYYTAVYSVVTATNFTWYSSICRNTPSPTGIEYLSLSGLCAFQTLLKFHKYSPGSRCWHRLGHINDIMGVYFESSIRFKCSFFKNKAGFYKAFMQFSV